MNEPMSDRIDVLGPRLDRHQAFTKTLLSEIEDDVLNSIVSNAAQNLSTPIALVNFILEKIQFFKAHYGLPEDLRTIRATDRDVSFCQYVVRDEDLLEVNDAKIDSRIPQYLVKAYGLRSYLGVPISFGGTVVGSLCVIDLKPRTFTEKDREALIKLANLVNEHLYTIGKSSSHSGFTLLEKSTAPAIKEMQGSLVPILSELSSSYFALTEFKAYIRKAEFALKSIYPYPTDVRDSLQKATDLVMMLEDHLYNIEMSSNDVSDTLTALEKVFNNSQSTTLEDVILSGRELSRGNSRLVGGIYIPDIEYNPYILTSRPLAVSLISTCISMLAVRLMENNIQDRIILDVKGQDTFAIVLFECKVLSLGDFAAISDQLNLYLNGEPFVHIESNHTQIRLKFNINPMTSLLD